MFPAFSSSSPQVSSPSPLCFPSHLLLNSLFTRVFFALSTFFPQVFVPLLFSAAQVFPMLPALPIRLSTSPAHALSFLLLPCCFSALLSHFANSTQLFTISPFLPLFSPSCALEVTHLASLDIDARFLFNAESNKLLLLFNL